MAKKVRSKQHTRSQADKPQDAKKMLDRIFRVAELLAQTGNINQSETAANAGKERLLSAEHTKC